MYKNTLLSLFLLFMFGCAPVTPELGMEQSAYASQCGNSSQVGSFANGDAIMNCPQNKGRLDIFRNGVFVESVDWVYATARVEHEQCLSYGAAPNTDAYTNCRLTLAQMRAQQDAANAAQQQANSAALMWLGLGLMEASQPRPAPVTNTNINMTCTSRQAGIYTHINCF